MLLYKYCKPDGINILKDCNLRFSPPNKFNDPFEFLPQIVPSTANTKLLDIDNARNLIKSTVSEKIGVLSLSYTHENILMWSHYTDSHTGLVIGIETTGIGPTEGIFKVDYTQRRPLLNFNSDFRPILSNKEDVFRLVKTKSVSWAYEDEYRIILKNERFPIKDGYFYLPIDPFCIKRVIIGCNSDKEFIDSVIDELASERFEHVKLFWAFLDNNDFKLIFFDWTDKLREHRESKNKNIKTE